MARWFMILAGLAGAAGVGFSAVAAHALQATLTDQAVEWVETAGTYLLLHAPALAVCALIRPGRLVAASGFLFTAGLAGFSGGLLILALADFRPAVAIVPVGGTLLILAWIALGAVGLKWSVTARNSQKIPSESGANRSIDSTGQV